MMRMKPSERLSRTVLFHIKPEEYTILKKRADETGLDINTYLRFQLFGAKNLPPMEIECEACGATILRRFGPGRTRRFCNNACRMRFSRRNKA